MLKSLVIFLLAWQAGANIINSPGSINSENLEIKPAAIYDKPKKWWEHANFYQLYPRSFMDSDGNGKGDLKGMIAKLDHLKDLGITAAWLSPVMQSPQRDLGYDISDYKKIEPDYGNMTDFENLVTKCHELGIKLLLDFIPNHTSDKHEWFIESEKGTPKYRDYYVWKNGTDCKPETTEEENADDDDEPPCKPPNNWVSVFEGPAWTWSNTRKQFYLHQFTEWQPDLNYRNPEVVKEMEEVMSFYLDKGVDGFRLDAINHMYEDADFRDEPLSTYCKPGEYCYLEHIYTKDQPEMFEQVYSWRAFLDKYTEEKGTDDKILFTEAYTLNIDNTIKFYRSSDGKQKGAHMPFNFELIYAFSNKGLTARQLKGSIDYWFTNVPAGFTSNWVVGSHDHSRIASRFGSERIEVANAIMFTLPGTSVSYYGEECGMTDNQKIREEGEREGGSWKYDGRDPARTPMQWDDTKNAGFSTAEETWLAIPDNYKELNVAKVKAKDNSIYWQFIDLTKLRKEKTFIYGDANVKVVNEDVIAISRELHQHDTYVLVANLQKTVQQVDLSLSFATLPDKVKVAFKTSPSQYTKLQEIDTNKVTLQPFDAVILMAKYTNSASSFGISIGLVLLAVIRQIFM